MAELHIDDDWKRQAQEEKRRLAEQAAAKAAAAPTPAGAISTSGPAASGGAPGGRSAGRAGERGRGERELPEANFSTLVQQTLTQILLYVGELAMRGSEGMVNLDMAKHHLDILGMLEEKTKGNLTPDEKELLDNALYEGRMRFVSVAQRHAELP